VVTEPPKRGPQEGDELWFGLVGPIRVTDVMTPEREASVRAGRIAQAAHSLIDLAALVRSHPDPRVRCQAIPRLRARFPDDPETLHALAAASVSADAMVRLAAVIALGDLDGPDAADLIAQRLHDGDFEVRLFAAEGLACLGDKRAPADPETWVLESMLDLDEHDETP
jgi:HEAT repeat protein